MRWWVDQLKSPPKLPGFAVGQICRHLALGYHSEITAITDTVVRYKRLNAGTRFSLRHRDFVHTYTAVRRVVDE